ncbi:hypothetical protein VKT23_001286 [Stygiomarasmius scandens]|uniref:Uncharacterized protein n=1 Tax=Marasmiellus scandens TaxID=2682957 RepID=A0ABR1K7M8_9AGAR
MLDRTFFCPKDEKEAILELAGDDFLALAHVGTQQVQEFLLNNSPKRRDGKGGSVVRLVRSTLPLLLSSSPVLDELAKEFISEGRQGHPRIFFVWAGWICANDGEDAFTSFGNTILLPLIEVVATDIRLFFRHFYEHQKKRNLGAGSLQEILLSPRSHIGDLRVNAHSERDDATPPSYKQRSIARDHDQIDISGSNAVSDLDAPTSSSHWPPLHSPFFPEEYFAGDHAVRQDFDLNDAASLFEPPAHFALSPTPTTHISFVSSNHIIGPLTGPSRASNTYIRAAGNEVVKRNGKHAY